MQLLAENSNKYAMQKGKHGFLTSPSELRLLMASASDLLSTMALYKSVYLLTYLTA